MNRPGGPRRSGRRLPCSSALLRPRRFPLDGPGRGAPEDRGRRRILPRPGLPGEGRTVLRTRAGRPGSQFRDPLGGGTGGGHCQVHAPAPRRRPPFQGGSRLPGGRARRPRKPGPPGAGRSQASRGHDAGPTVENPRQGRCREGPPGRAASPGLLEKEHPDGRGFRFLPFPPGDALRRAAFRPGTFRGGVPAGPSRRTRGTRGTRGTRRAFRAPPSRPVLPGSPLPRRGSGRRRLPGHVGLPDPEALHPNLRHDPRQPEEDPGARPKAQVPPSPPMGLKPVAQDPGRRVGSFRRGWGMALGHGCLPSR